MVRVVIIGHPSTAPSDTRRPPSDPYPRPATWGPLFHVEQPATHAHPPTRDPWAHARSKVRANLTPRPVGHGLPRPVTD